MVTGMSLIKRALCALRGDHVPGDLLFRYSELEPAIGQNPRLRGLATFHVLGSECQRCGVLIDPSGEELSKFSAGLRRLRG